MLANSSVPPVPRYLGSVFIGGLAAATGEGANKLRAAVACTSYPVVGVRVLLASKTVPGWNELDAIGVVPCAE